jgi:hypothetical protein
VGLRGDQPQPGLRQQARKLTHDSGRAHDHRLHRALHRLAELRVVATEGQRRVVAVEDGHRPARADDARGLGEHRERVADVADQRVGDGDVEARGREVQRVRVTDYELDAVAEALVGGKPLGGRDEPRTLVDPGHGAGEAVARGNRARHDAGAAAEVEDRRRARQLHDLQIRFAVGREGRVLGAELQPLDEPFERRGVLLVDELHRVARLHLCRHGPSSGSRVSGRRELEVHGSDVRRPS